MKPFEVSIITPVYNAEKFLKIAVASALQFSCVKEVILVEDASPDNALAVCIELVAQDPRVKLFQHPNGENRGAGASRNLGLQQATAPFVAFLDADDWYEPNRFDIEQRVLVNEEYDGVYGATGFYYQNLGKRDENNKMTTFIKEVAPQSLLYEILKPGGGRFTTDAITFRKSLLEKTGLFNTNLRLHQDSDMWNRVAFHGKLRTGIIDMPVAFRRVHDNNRISGSNKKSATLYQKSVLDYFESQSNVDKRILSLVLKNLIIASTASNNNIHRLITAIKLILAKPKRLKYFI